MQFSCADTDLLLSSEQLHVCAKKETFCTLPFYTGPDAPHPVCYPRKRSASSRARAAVGRACASSAIHVCTICFTSAAATRNDVCSNPASLSPDSRLGKISSSERRNIGHQTKSVSNSEMVLMRGRTNVACARGGFANFCKENATPAIQLKSISQKLQQNPRIL